MANGVRRVVVYNGPEGYTWKAQGGNWRTIDTSRKPVARRATVLRQIAQQYPGVEVVDGA